MKQSTSRKGFLTQSSSLFSISTGVQLPFVGSHDSITKLQQSSHSLLSSYQPSSLFTDKQMRSVSKQMLDYAGDGLVFSSDVVKERSLSSLYPHRDVTDSRSILPMPALTNGKKSSRRRNKRTTAQNPGNIPQRQQIIRPRHHRPTTKQINNVTETRWVKQKEGEYIKSEMMIGGNCLPTAELKSCPPSPHDNNQVLKSGDVTQDKRWDEEVVQNVSQETANHIVVLQNACNDRIRLEKLVNTLFGQKTAGATATTQEPTDQNDPEAMEKKRKIENDRLKMERKNKKIQSLKEDPFLNTSLSQYYKLPWYVRKHQQRNIDYSDVNKTCQNIQVKSVESVATTIHLQQFFNNKVNKTVLPTQNDFEIKMLTGGATQLHDPRNTNKSIKMSDNSEFQLHLQQVYPQDRKECLVAGKCTEGGNMGRRLRWIMKPTQLDKQAGFNQYTEDDGNRNDGADEDEIICGKLVDNQPLVYAVESWRTKWKLSNNWHDIKLSDIMIDLQSVHDVVRFSAMSTCVAASLYSIPQGKQDITAFGDVMRTKHASEIWNESLEEIYTTSKQPAVGHLPDILIEAARDKLYDENKRVQLAASMCLHACGFGDDVTLNILEHHLQHGLESDQMVAAQLIALRGEPKAKVVQQMVNFLLEGEEEVEQATALLVHLSQYTRLVHSLLAEQLNNSNWKVRSTVCDVLGNVKGQINRDLVNKLKKMMFQDWNSEVRRAAARVLGKTGNGAAIHYELRDKLLRGSERETVEGLKTVAHINIMTASLLSAFIQCFSSDYMAVRIEACLTAAKMKMNNEKIIVQLVRLVDREYSWKVKAHAIKAISYIGLVNDDVIRVLLYALTFDSETAVRLESCHALHLLMCNTPKVVNVIQERLHAEEDCLVIEEMRNCLRSFGVNADESAFADGLEEVIQREVERICSKNATTNKIILYEREEERLEIEKLMIGNRPPPPKDDVMKATKTTTISSAGSRYNHNNDLLMINEEDEDEEKEEHVTNEQQDQMDEEIALQ